VSPSGSDTPERVRGTTGTGGAQALQDRYDYGVGLATSIWVIAERMDAPEPKYFVCFA
jgi:hypothetical protein